ncbi:hypothetical protein [Bradyrhizobium sp. CB2312]|uniref:hypothetical protein n=1 Tax=Bradyrhizobium sp. CB2312 TaxID=3039155 RepID=UPI0024B12D0D|nr:hypothetical protein [Bradyrhizobium sp. CB2312]WFU76645.1 hypothetical protein QA642_22920 [Bradyrhizobium sp. CB2312]
MVSGSTAQTELRVLSEEEWSAAIAANRVRGSDQRSLMTHIIPSVGPGSTEKIDVVFFFAIPATLAYEVIAVVAGVVAGDIVGNKSKERFLPSNGFSVVTLPPIPVTKSLAPHRGTPG